MQAVGTKNRTSLHSIDDSILKTRGSLSMGSGGHVRKRRRGSLSFGISKQLTIHRLKEIIRKKPEVVSNLLLLLERIHQGDSDSMLRFEDIDVITDVCLLLFNNTSDVILKQRILAIAIYYAVTYNRYGSMRTIKDEMIATMSDEELRQSAAFLRANKDHMASIEDSLGSKHSLRVRKIVGLD